MRSFKPHESNDYEAFHSGSSTNAKESLKRSYVCKKRTGSKEIRRKVKAKDDAGRMKKECPKYAAWSTGCYLDLVDTFVSPTFKRNLVSTSSLDKNGYFVVLEMEN
ncbi:hypothetical protein V2J09_013276 [Rumex salicifolius]